MSLSWLDKLQKDPKKLLADAKEKAVASLSPEDRAVYNEGIAEEEKRNKAGEFPKIHLAPAISTGMGKGAIEATYRKIIAREVEDIKNPYQAPENPLENLSFVIDPKAPKPQREQNIDAREKEMKQNAKHLDKGHSR